VFIAATRKSLVFPGEVVRTKGGGGFAGIYLTLRGGVDRWFTRKPEARSRRRRRLRQPVLDLFVILICGNLSER